MAHADLSRFFARVGRFASGRTSPSRVLRVSMVSGLVAVAMIATACGASDTGGTNAAKSPGQQSASPAPSGSVTSPAPATTSGLATSLDTAYAAETGALATYQNVVKQLGNVLPFPNIITAEQQHVATVKALLTAHGLAVPGAAPGQSSPATLTAACSLGVSTEQNMISMYEQAAPQVTAYADVVRAFDNLKQASQVNHLPAFQACA